ncbi:OprO/OprP family phosphate-selective porin [Opitutus terrae]|uniref:Phosphate-selective porin O and P n=1 Tax=Opitutus terrae (strain DSM 11246 / JCM 15787 / PB90-1) TaxID=452637 RepID=B1ZMR5_OPITP|nr:porin [Opitutus terrae]ACB75343.1 phosphate-selective porin O and P [Opitutus terrae PB90-1]
MRTFRLFLSVAALIAVTQFGSTRSLAASSSDEIEALREQIRQLDQKLRALERKQELRDEAAATAAKPPVVTAAASGFGFAAADKAFELRIRGLFQFDARFFLDDGAPNRDQFLLRRIRTPLTGTVAGIYEFNITPELGGGTNSSTTVALWDAFVAARFSPAFGVRFGKFPSAVGLEPGSNRHFIESPFVNSLLPNRDLGVEFFGTLTDGLIDYRLGVVVGVPNNTTNFGGASPDLNDGDRTLAGRITLHPFTQLKDSPFAKLSLGVGFSHGNEQGVAGANLSNGLSNVTSQAQQLIFNYGPTLYAAGTHTRISPSAEWYPGTPFSAVAEYAHEEQDIAVDATGLTRTFENTAWRATVGYVLTGEEATKSGVNPKTAFSVGDGGWGAFEVVARVSGLDLDSALTRPVAAGGAGLSRNNNVKSAFAYGLGLNWYLNRSARFLINLENTEYEGAKTPTAAIGARDDELVFITRAQLTF